MSELKSAAAKWSARTVGDGAPGQDDRTRLLTPAEREWKESIYERLLKVLDLSLLASVEDNDARRQIREVCENLITEERAPLSVASRQTIIRRIEDEVLGLGPLEPLLADKTVSDILVNGPQQVYVERRGKLELTDITFNNDSHLINIIDRIVSAVGRRVDESSPMVDARLKDGSRVNAIIPPLALDGAVLSIRRFAVELLSIDDLIRLGSLTSAVAKAMGAIVKARLNVVVSGGTGAGKTTLLNLLSGFIPTNERIVTIEDSAELQLQQPHVVRLETRPPNIEGRGAITQRDLVRNSLRMRPDRIVLGEVRGGEALDMLQAMNTGHDGSLTTIHANTPRDALGRIENMVSMTGISFPVKALRAQISSAIDVVIQVERMEDGRRRVVSVQEINGMEGDVITSTELFVFERRGMDSDGNVLGELRSTGIVPGFLKDMHARGIELPVELFRRDDDALFVRR
ncbi:MAG TPA: CpaF family protein [Steroidobacteraceae bacterium]|nr:CpaF family protein [Steroidobacteraceae bacterium]